MITADCGGSNGPQFKLWKRELQHFANETCLKIAVTHLSPGTSWNKIEHRLFAFITQNWRGKPLVNHQMIVQFIGATTTETGLKVCCEIDGNLYPEGPCPIQHSGANRHVPPSPLADCKVIAVASQYWRNHSHYRRQRVPR